jgi:hypothetical protein
VNRQPARYTVACYDSKDDFYDEAGPRARRWSMERDFGVMWTDPLLPGQAGPGWPNWRVSLVVDTGDVYAECATPDPRTRKCPVRLYGRLAAGDADAAEAVLANWWDYCHTGGQTIDGLGGGLMWLERIFRARHEQQARGGQAG